MEDVNYYGAMLARDAKQMGRAKVQIAERCIVDGKTDEDISSANYPSNNASFVFKLNKYAKPTDFISVSGYSTYALMVNERTYGLLSEYKMYPHRVYDAEVIDYKGTSYPYKWLHFCSNNLQCIDFKKSICARFIDPYLRYGKIEEIKIDSEEEYYSLRKKDSQIGIDIVAFTEAFREQGYDFFLLAKMYYFFDMIFSKELGNRIIENRLTSIQFTQLLGWR